jgi:hypothetical protein
MVRSDYRSGSKSGKKYLSLGGAPGDTYTEDQVGNILIDNPRVPQATPQQLAAAQAAATGNGQEATPEQLAAQAAATGNGQVQMGGKRRGRKSKKHGGDAGAGLLTAGTLLLIQAATRELLKRQKSAPAKGRRRQSGGQVIQSMPAGVAVPPPISPPTGVVPPEAMAGASGWSAKGGSSGGYVASMLGGSMCGLPPQMGGRKHSGRSRKTHGGGVSGVLNTTGELDKVYMDSLTGGAAKKTKRSRKTHGGGASGILNTTGDLTTAFAGVSHTEQAQAAHMPPVQVGGKHRGRPRKTHGGACALGMAELKDAFMPVPEGAIPFPTGNPPITPDTLTDLKALTGGAKGKKKAAKAAKPKSKK